MNTPSLEMQLYLILHKQWFDLILSGEKKVEYRDIQPYWTKRLFNPDGSPKQYSTIRFVNGYGKHRPSIEVEFLGVRINENTQKYEILLGDVLGREN